MKTLSQAKEHLAEAEKQIDLGGMLYWMGYIKTLKEMSSHPPVAS